MEEMVRVARSLREEHGFAGYIHLKIIPNAAPELLAAAGRYADRLSTNIEMPTDQGLGRFAPEKRPGEIRTAMARVSQAHEAAQPEAKARHRPDRFAPAGQSTQMIVGADGSSDAIILNRSAALYAGYGLKRVYYSAFSPIPDSSAKLPLTRPPLMREHRLYQADWLMRFYGFEAGEIAVAGEKGMLDLAIDPKLACALRSRHVFPVDVNRADKAMLLRVPGLGLKAVEKIIATRRHHSLRLDDVGRVCASLKAVRPFIETIDWTPGKALEADDLRARLTPKPQQMSLF
jgi:predicted DNA-binding helix-hairpin-helix protein